MLVRESFKYQLHINQSHHCRYNTEVDAGLSTPIPKLVINGVSAEEQPEGEGDHDKDSDAGSVYDGSVYGTDSHHTDSNDDLASKGQLDLHLK